MKKAASAFLRMEICHADITRMIRWMRNPNVNKYLNEAPDVAQSLEQLVRFVPKPFVPDGAFLHGLSSGKRERGLRETVADGDGGSVRKCM